MRQDFANMYLQYSDHSHPQKVLHHKYRHYHKVSPSEAQEYVPTYMPMKTNITTTKSLRHDDQNSSSANPRVPKTQTMANKEGWKMIHEWEEKQDERNLLTDDNPEYSNPCR